MGARRIKQPARYNRFGRAEDVAVRACAAPPWSPRWTYRGSNGWWGRPEKLKGEQRHVESPMAASSEAESEPTDEDLSEQVREALEAEGFRWELWQKPERGQKFGMIRREDEEMQLHVRYYEGGVVKAERELANDYVEHLLSPRESVHEEVQRLLAKHGLGDEVDVREKVFPDRHQGSMPSTRTPWKPLVMGVGVALFGAVAGTSLWPFGDD